MSSSETHRQLIRAERSKPAAIIEARTVSGFTLNRNCLRLPRPGNEVVPQGLREEKTVGALRRNVHKEVIIFNIIGSAES